MRTKILATLLAASVLLASKLSFAATDLERREEFAHSFANIVLSVITDTKKNMAERKDLLRTAFSKSVDIDWIARFVLGPSWRSATDEQRARYTELYRHFLTETYVANFAENPDKRIRDIKIDAVNNEEASNDDFTVATDMMLADMEDLRVKYLVNEKDGHYKVRDIAIENVSLITTHRSEFSQLAANGGIDAVIAKLEHLNSDANSFKSASN